MSAKESVLTYSDNPGDILNNVCDVLHFLTDSFYCSGVVLDDSSVRGLSLIIEEIHSSVKHANEKISAGSAEKASSPKDESIFDNAAHIEGLTKFC